MKPENKKILDSLINGLNDDLNKVDYTFSYVHRELKILSKDFIELQLKDSERLYYYHAPLILLTSIDENSFRKELIKVIESLLAGTTGVDN